MRKTTDSTKNERYFQNIDSEEKAYFLGFLLADGSISPKTNRLMFTIKSTDSYILERFKESIGSSNIVRTYSVFDKRKNHFNYSSCFQVSSKYIKQDLLNLGIGSDKSKIFDHTKIINNPYYSHFLRGLFDGDGYISKERTIIMLISTKEFLEYISENFFDKDFRMEQLVNNVYRVYIQNKAMCVKFLDFIYKDATIFLTRKHDLYLDLKQRKIYNVYRQTPCKLITSEGAEKLFNSIKEAAESLGTDSGSLLGGMRKRGHYKKNVLVKGKSIKMIKELV